MNRFALIAGSLMSALAVAFGAFGAHALAAITSTDRLATWETGARYLMYHGLALLAIGVLSALLTTTFRWPVRLIFSGTVIFTGSLFLLVLTHTPWLGALTPLGGVLLIGGWTQLAYAIAKLPTLRPTH
ncbi:DUF423 domain-containing protein [Reinekea sp.]|jgi:uncharacterized membrane protein YgdD (TMEM256/DUF423 family)|uniref:DUF423 domain-containing protein n=1 Tax=Reinekea sp. TaxID=1970455 RepID=UPI002A82FDFC|nr:DUF423 domain-containing protein [Reinekea sp.]